MALKIRRMESAKSGQVLDAGMHPVLERVYRHRGVTSKSELQLSLKGLLDYSSLKDISRAASIIAGCIHKQESILIVGDFDADGATSCAVAVRALKMMGAQQVNYLVPNRFEYGYGLTPEIVEVALQSNPDLIITVDNGISSIEGVAAARAHGIRVVITDHHLQGDQLPNADAVVNPNQSGDEFPSKAMAGVGVIFYVMLALRAYLRENEWFNTSRPEPNLAELLDLVALGTVADVVPLDYNNRILVAQGIARMSTGACCIGIKAIIDVAGKKLSQIRSQDLGFILGPRLNAAGRLHDMSLGIECLSTDNEAIAYDIARQLCKLNDERRVIEQDMKAQALDSLEQLDLGEDMNMPYGLSLYQADWHQGVIGILASRMKDKFHRPVIAFADGGEDSETGVQFLKGSARSIAGLHIRDALDAIATRYSGMLTKFGGHAMAAGLTLPKARFEEFRQAFDEEVRRSVSEDALSLIIHSDGELTHEDIDLPLAKLINDAGPWGQNFPEPLFDGRFEIVEKRIVGEKHLKLLLRVPDSNRLVDAIAFNTVDDVWPEQSRWVEIVYKLAVNEFRGTVSAQLVIDHIEPVLQMESSVQC